MHRVMWNESEREQVYAEANRIKEENPGIPWSELWPKAQEILPAERRRTWNAAAPASVEKQRFTLWKEQRQLTFQRPAPSPDPMSQAVVGPQIIIVEKIVRVKEDPDYGKIPTGTLARILLERLEMAESVQAHLMPMLNAAQQQHVKEQAYDSRVETRMNIPKPEPEPIRIVIVGPLGSQESDIERVTGSLNRKLKLRFFDKDKNGELPMIVDYAICTKHVNHAWWDKMKAALPSDKVFFVNGTQGVIQKLYDIASRQ